MGVEWWSALSCKIICGDLFVCQIVDSKGIERYGRVMDAVAMGEDESVEGQFGEGDEEFRRRE